VKARPAQGPPPRDDQDNRNIWRISLAVIVVSLVLRLIVLWITAEAPLASDSSDYRAMAVRLLSGEKFVPYWPPGLSLYLAPFVAAGFSDLVLRASMLGWWLVFCVAFVSLARDLGVRKNVIVALLAVFSITPALIHFSIEPMTQMPAAALLLLALGATVRCSVRGGTGQALWLGLLLGALSLVRPSVLPMLLALPAMVFLRQRRVFQPILAVAIGAVLLVVWMARVHQLDGQWALNNSNGVNLYYGNNPWTPLYRTWYFGSHAKIGSDEILEFPEFKEITERIALLPELERGAEYKRLAIEAMKEEPGLFLLRTANRVRCFWGFDTFTAANVRGAGAAGRRWFPVVFGLDAICYLAVVGWAFFWVTAARGVFWPQWETWLLAGTVLLYALPYWVTMSHPTYHFPVIAPLALLGARAAASGGGARWRGWAAVAVLGLIQVEWLFYLTKS
jgi:hypothetical protein